MARGHREFHAHGAEIDCAEQAEQPGVRYEMSFERALSDIPRIVSGDGKMVGLSFLQT